MEISNHVDDVVSKPKNAKKNRYLIIIGILIFALLASSLGYWYWTKTPQYSLRMIQQAVTKHDLPAFDRLVDLDTIIPRAIDQLMSSKINDPDEVQDEAINGLVMGFLQNLKPAIVSSAKEQIRSYVEKGNFDKIQDKDDGTKPDFNIENVYKNVGGETSEFKGVDYVKKDGKIAVVGLKFYYPQLAANVILEFKMRELDGYWQLAEINNLGDFITKVDNLKKEKLAEINKPVIEQMSQNVQIDNISMTASNDDSWGLSKSARFAVTVTNAGSQEIAEIGGTINVKSADGKYLLKYPVRTSQNTIIVPGKSINISWKKHLNSFIKSDEVLFNSIGGNVTAEMFLRYVKFADGTELKLADKL